jgi:hypothetical protein
LNHLFFLPLIQQLQQVRQEVGHERPLLERGASLTALGTWFVSLKIGNKRLIFRKLRKQKLEQLIESQEEENRKNAKRAVEPSLKQPAKQP